MPRAKKKPTKAPNKGGRPSKYQDAFAEQARKLCLLGFTDKELADFFSISERTLNYWKNQHPMFLQALQKGKPIADANVAASLYHRAIGYSHPEVKVFAFEGNTFEHEVVRHYPPDTAAAFIWLKNRRPQDWKNQPTEAQQQSEVHITLNYHSAPEPKPEDTPEFLKEIEKEIDSGLH